MTGYVYSGACFVIFCLVACQGIMSKNEHGVTNKDAAEIPTSLAISKSLSCLQRSTQRLPSET